MKWCSFGKMDLFLRKWHIVFVDCKKGYRRVVCVSLSCKKICLSSAFIIATLQLQLHINCCNCPFNRSYALWEHRNFHHWEREINSFVTFSLWFCPSLRDRQGEIWFLTLWYLLLTFYMCCHLSISDRLAIETIWKPKNGRTDPTLVCLHMHVVRYCLHWRNICLVTRTYIDQLLI